MSKITALFLVLCLSFNTLFAIEGMWIPLFLGEMNEEEMQAMGMNITAEDIYSINQASLKDAIVMFGGGCTGELISGQGLLLTNHHCGYRVIQSHSTVEHDYLTNGFWAMNREDELPNKSLSVTFLVRMEEVTTSVLEGVSIDMPEAKRAEIIEENSARITEEATEGTHYEADVKPFFNGNRYFLFITEVFRDVRLVGAPPSNIGKFGGDTDNWMWPRHTGDFSLFRIYADKDNKPAEYSTDNVPFKPRKHMKISLKGTQKGDFTFVFGYPGRTSEYLHSSAVDFKVNSENPVAIALREQRLAIMDRYMQDDPAIRIQYSAKYASVANFWKKMIGESRGIHKLNGIQAKLDAEAEFRSWVDADEARQDRYGNVLPEFERIYSELNPLSLDFTYFLEAGHSVELIRYGLSFIRLVNMCSNDEVPEEQITELVDRMKNGVEGHYKDYYAPVDQEILAASLRTWGKGASCCRLPGIYKTIGSKFNNDYDDYAAHVFGKSILTDKARTAAFLDGFTRKKYKKLVKDPGYVLAASVYEFYYEKVRPGIATLEESLDSLYRVYMQGLIEIDPGARIYPDANSTLRVAYGKVDDYSPRDAVEYRHFTTLEGILEKEDPAVYDYVVEIKLKELAAAKDYGRYAASDGTMHVCFTASNHTTGGNSGSPVLNADGHLIGTNFDRNWEGTMSDLMYDPDQCRNITLDIRYALFIIDKFAGASHLISEMDIVE